MKMYSRVYDYAEAQQYCHDCGMFWMDDWVDDADVAFVRLNLTQEQVDGLMREYIWRMKHMFTPHNYTLWQRFALAYHFLFGKLKGKFNA